MMKNTFNFKLKAFLVLGIFTLLSRIFGYEERRLGHAQSMVEKLVPDPFIEIRN